MSDVLTIGKYQLENLMKNGVRFHYFDLSDGATSQHALLAGSRRLSPTDALVEIERLGLSKDAPIVLICEHGLKSLEVARLLGENSYLNVYVVDGGFASLS